MRYSIFSTAFISYMSLAATAFAKHPEKVRVAIPELDPQAGGAVFVLLAGLIAVLTSRRRRLVG